MHKNTEPFLAFNKEWFEKNQRLLLWLLNAPVIKIWFRWLLEIRWNAEITDVQPNSFSYGDRLIKKNGKWDIERTTTFYSFPIYGERIYYSFFPLWWIIHFWDWLIADRFIPRWSYGFSTLTANPDGGVATVDGAVNRSLVNEAFSTIQSGAGTTVQAFNTLGLDASSTSNQFQRLKRLINTFDTSSLTSAATISAAVISWYGATKTNGLGSPDFHVASATPASNNALVAADYAQTGSTSFGSIAYASISTGAYNDFTLNASGIANISKTGISKFSLKLSWDINNSFSGIWASSANSGADFYAVSDGISAQYPKLVVTYTLGGSFPPRLKLNQAVKRASFY